MPESEVGTLNLNLQITEMECLKISVKFSRMMHRNLAALIVNVSFACVSLLARCIASSLPSKKVRENRCPQWLCTLIARKLYMVS